MNTRPDRPEESAAAPETTRGAPVFTPPTDIHETEAGLVLTVELPGVDIDDVGITLEKRVLTIAAQARDVHPTGYALSHEEYALGAYERAFTLHETIDVDDIAATMKDGVLTLELKKAGPPKEKQIKIRPG